MISDCTRCGLELGSVFVFVDRHTRLCLDCAESRTAPHNPHNPQNPTNRPKEDRTS